MVGQKFFSPSSFGAIVGSGMDKNQDPQHYMQHTLSTLGSAGGSQERMSVSPSWVAERLRGGPGCPSLVRTAVTGAW
jgi:hypothetical protein